MTSPFFRSLLAVFSAVFFLAPQALAVPTVTARVPAVAATVSVLTQVSVTFSEAVTGVDADDLLINADAALFVTGSGAGPYVFTFSQPPPGTVNVDFASDHGIAGQAGTGSLTTPGLWSYTLTDTIAPTFLNAGGVTAIAVRTGGSGYTSAPAVAITGGGGSGATATAQYSGVTTLTLTGGGTGYTLNPTVAFSGGGGSGAAAVAVISNAGVVTAVTITSGGTGYTSTPAVTITAASGGAGSGATATAAVSTGQVTGFTITNAGSGYISAPAVALTGGVGTGATAGAGVRGVAVTPAPNSTVATLTQAEVNFSEVVNGVDAADLLVNGVAAAAVTGSGAGPYVFTFTQPAAGPVTFSWAGAHSIVDTAASPNAFGGTTWTVTLSGTGHGTLVLNEFLAANGVGLADEDGEQQDWIEIYNSGATTVNLAGWALTDDHDKFDKWIFPEWTLNAGQYMVVWASDKDRKPPQKTAGLENAGTAGVTGSPRLHTNFTINENGGYLALVAPETPRAVVTQYPANYNELALPPVTDFATQRTDYSYGPQSTDSALRYYATPTPKLSNGTSTLTAITPKVSPSVGRGFFKDAFSLVLSCPDATAVIRYTTDFTEPTVSNGTVYTVPITISATTCLRAVAFGTSKVASLPVTHSYVFLDQVLAQTNTPAGFPTNWGTAYGSNVFAPASGTAGLVPADYEMDSEPLGGDPVKIQRLKDGLRELPLVSVTIPNADMFNATGMYAYPNVTNKNFAYKKCAAEMILPDGSTAFSVICGITGHGNASRDPLKNPKHGFQFKFKGDFGEGSLNYQLFDDSPVKNYDDVILRPDFNTSWRHWSDDTTNANGAFQRSRGTRLHDAWNKDTLRAMGGLASHHRFFHLFINGLYWGVYDFAEQPVDGFAANQMGGSKNDYDIIHEGNLRGGTGAVYSAMISQPATTTNALYDTMKGYLDVTEFIDYTLLHFYNGHQDWDVIKNWYAIRRRASATNPTEGKFQYVPWDQECSLLETNVNRVATTTNQPSGLHGKLVSNAQYKLDFADRVQRHMIAPTGALTPVANITRWNKWQAVLDKPIVAESCRWGDYRRDVHNYNTGSYVLYTRENQWLAECTRKTTGYFPAAFRPATVLSQLQTGGLYPAAAAPEYRQNTTGGVIVGTSQVSAPFVVALNNPGAAGIIYYTTDGNDPHISYTATTGATVSSVAATALTYATPLTLNATITLKSRILSSTGTWSALNEATFTVGSTLPSVRITEIMYNPPGGTAYEFLELQNTGATTVDMSGWYLEGVDFFVPFGTVLNPSDRIVLANNDGQNGLFAVRYPGVAVFGWFSGSLDNGGERIALRDATGRIVVSVEYSDHAGWPTTPDGGGYSLEIIDPNGDPDSPVNWKASAVLKGSPGQANSVPPATGIVINEVLADNAGVVAVGSGTDDYIELKNTGVVPVEVNGWTVASSAASYTFGASTVIAPGGFLVLPCSPNAGGAHLTAVLPAGGGYVQLKTAAGEQADAVQYGNQLPNLAIGRVGSAWVLTAPTPAADNVAASVAPAAGNLVLNEWLSDAVPGGTDWLEIYNKHATLPVALQGLYFQTDTQLYRYPLLAFVAPHGWLQLFADEQPGANQLDCKLPATGTALAILDAAGVSIDTVSGANFGVPPQGVSRGRTTDGAVTFTTFTGSASPGAANYVNTWTGPVLNEILARNVANAAADWVELTNPTGSAFDLTGMKLGTSSDGAGAWTFPAGSIIAAGGQLALAFDPFQSSSASNTALTLGDNSGGLYLFNTSGQLVNQIEWGVQIADKSIGLDSGVWKLLASPTRGLPNSAAQTLGAVTQLRINEWMAQPNAGGDWFEIYNLDANPVALAGLYLTDDPSELGRKKFLVPALSFIAAQGWVKWEADNAPELGRNHVNFTLDGNGEYLRISNSDAGVTALDTVSFGQQTGGVSQGRILDGAATIVAMPGSPTPGAKNVLLPAPSFSTQPLSQTVMNGTNVSFLVAASGSAPLTLQWKFNGVNLPGATAATLALTAVTAANDGTYTCVATNSAGSVSSSAATLIVQYTYAQWAVLKGLTSPNDVTTADPDGDSVKNLQEFFHNLNPQLAADFTALPQPALEPPTGPPQYLTLTYRRSARAVLTNVEHQLSLTLANGSWSTAAPDVTENLAPDPVTGDPRVRVKFTIQPGETAKFLRLLLTP